jgi:hypothetical protein
MWLTWLYDFKVDSQLVSKMVRMWSSPVIILESPIVTAFKDLFRVAVLEIY